MLKKIATFLAVALMSIAVQQVSAQELLTSVPTTKAEFIASEKQVLITINWLETTPFDQDETMRKAQNALLLQWLTESPTVTMELNTDVIPFMNTSPDLLLIFMGGWARYCLQNKYSTNNVQGSLAGIRSVIRVYKNMALKKDPELEKLIALDEKGQLDGWVKTKVAKK